MRTLEANPTRINLVELNLRTLIDKTSFFVQEVLFSALFHDKYGKDTMPKVEKYLCRI